MKISLEKLVKLALIITVLFTVSSFVNAQESNTGSLSSIYLNMSPDSPRAGDSVTLTVNSDTIDLNSSKITWYVDGSLAKNTSSKSLIIKMKSDGQTTTVRAVAETQDGIVKEVSQNISPSAIDLVIEPLSYTMPFYKGKPYFAPQGTVKIVAIPDVFVDGVRVSSKDLNFNWSKDDIVLGSSSGKGKDVLILYGQIPIRDVNIDVKIMDDSDNILAENSKLLTTDNPETLFFEDSPLYGVLYNKNLYNSYNLGTRENLNIVVKPFSFDFINDVTDASEYSWYVNGNTVAPSIKANEISLKQSSNVSGSASISLDLKNADRILQYNTNSLNIIFGQQ